MGNQSSVLTQAKTVVIVGGGYAGYAVAKKLDGNFNVILVERNNYKFHNVGALRACVEPEFAKNILLPYNRLLRNGIVINGEVISMTDKNVTVKQKEEKRDIPFDYCVIAVGTDYAFPAKTPLREAKELPAEYKALSEVIGKASHIVCIGAGPVGLELVGEIAGTYKTEMKAGTKKITLIHQGDKILNRYDYLSDKMRNKITAKLKDSFFNIDVRLGESVVSEQLVTENKEETPKKVEEAPKDAEEAPKDAEEAPKDETTEPKKEEEKKEEKKEETPKVVTDNKRYLVGKRIITTSKQNSIECDLIFYCNGSSISHIADETFLKDCINPSNGRIRVKKNLQIEKSGCDRIFALGDCADHSPQFAYVAAEQAEVVANNVKALEKGHRLKDYAMGMYAMLVPLGKQDGVGQMPGGFVVGGSVTSSIKGKTLFSEKSWKEFGFENLPEQPIYWDDTSIPLEKTYLSDERLARFAEKTQLTRRDLVGLISGKWDDEQKSEEKEEKTE